MRTILFGLFVGYFLTACAPWAWTETHLAIVAIVLLADLISLEVLRRRWGTRDVRTLPVLAGFLAGFLSAVLVLGLAVVHASIAGPKELSCTDHSLLARVQVLGLPQNTGDGSRFDATLLDVDPSKPQCLSLAGARVRLGFRGVSWTSPNQIMLAEVRLREIRGSVSPGAFDHEIYSVRRGTVLGGYVARVYAVRDPNLTASQPTMLFDHWRMGLRRYIAALELEYGGVVLALITGDTTLLNSANWELLQNSGTVHLMVISGLHVGLVSAWLFLLFRPLVLLLFAFAALVGRAGFSTAPLHALITSLATLLYVQLAGAGIPAQRAWVMVSVVLFGWAAERRLQPVALIFAAALGVVALQPLAGFEAGFWLSFALVAWLLVGTVNPACAAPADVEPSTLRLLLCRAFVLAKLHLGCTLLLLPLLIWLGLPVAPAGPVANFLAVPFVTLLLVPWVLLSATAIGLSAYAARLMFELADQLVAALVVTLRWFVEAWSAVVLPTFSTLALVCSALLTVVALLPVPARLRVFAGCALLIWLLQSSETGSAVTDGQQTVLQPGQFGLQFLDVGQGLAVLVRTADAVLLYDTGARFPSGFNYVDAVIAPALGASGIKQLDALVVSHSDNDHAGGVPLILRRFNPSRLGGSVRLQAGVDGVSSTNSDDPCHWRGSGKGTILAEDLSRRASDVRSSRWLSAGVEFELLSLRSATSTNNRSCLLVIRGSDATALLSGDIEAAAENALVEYLPMGVDVLTAPHHGSATSSTQAFVSQLHPGIAIVSAGYANRFGHPHSTVVARYEAKGVQVLNTATQGTIDWISTDVGRVRAWRVQRACRFELGAPLAVALATRRGKGEAAEKCR